MKKANYFILLCLSLFLVLPLSAFAYEAKSGNAVNVTADETISGNLYVGASTLTIDGTIEGDLFCAANTLTLNGSVTGDVICAANTIDINGPVGGSVRVIANTINLKSSIARGLQALGAFITVSPDAQVAWDAFVAGEEADILGSIGGDLHGALGHAVIEGEVARSVKLKMNNQKEQNDVLEVGPTAIIGENLYYTAGSIGSISNEAQIGGETKHSFYSKEENNNALSEFFSLLVSIFASLVLGLVLVSLLKRPLKKTISIMKNETKSAFFHGALALFLTPIIGILLLITIIGIPLAVILLLLWGIALYVAKVIFGVFIGNQIAKKYFPKETKSLIWSMIIGVTTVTIASEIPFFGWIVSLTALLWGLGAILLYLKKNSDNF